MMLASNNPFEFDAAFKLSPRKKHSLCLEWNIEVSQQGVFMVTCRRLLFQDTSPVTSKSTQQKTFGVKDAAMVWLGVKKKDGFGSTR
jgi:hypothetical protein